jgi:hypothetical protein
VNINKLIIPVLLVGVLLAPAGFAGTKGDDPHELLSKSFQQANLWNQGPVKLVAKVRMPNAKGQELNLQYTVSWAGPSKWRTEWSAPGQHQITVLNDGKLSYFTNRSSLPWSALEFEATLAALDGGAPAGPYHLAPLDYENAKLHVSKKKINGTDAQCIAVDKPTTTFCIDPANGHLLRADGELGSFEYSDYTTIGSNSYPQTVKGSYVSTSFEGDDYSWVHGVSYPRNLKEVHVTTPIEEAQVTVTRGEQFPDSLFVAPEKSITVDFPSCTNLATDFTPPRLDKSVKGKMPEAARKVHQYGQVWVLATVGKDGSVQKTTVLGNELPELNNAATSAVQQYTYTPYMRCGQSVEFQQMLVVPFAPPAPPVYTSH